MIKLKSLLERFQLIRKNTLECCKPLEIEDYCVQPATFVSPPKWHLAHTTWFFEQMILQRFIPNYKVFNEGYSKLFNSYYKQVGEHWLQADRGNLSRPTVKNIFSYRRYVDEVVLTITPNALNNDELTELESLLEVGINHEEQHQELLLMDIKYILAINPERPTYLEKALPRARQSAHDWLRYEGGIYEIGTSFTDVFCFDNETPSHKSFLNDFRIRNSYVTNGEYLEFIESGAYRSHKYWLSLGWEWINNENISCPLYWEKVEDDWYEFTLYGSKLLDENLPLSHISYFEADAFAKWKGCRLPTEFEYEIFLNNVVKAPHEAGVHPLRVEASEDVLWAWTSSQYSAYPGFSPLDGAVAEYNGKFMCNQFVLKGGCVATPKGHNRNTYRNFYLPEHRWMFSGIRLARDS